MLIEKLNGKLTRAGTQDPGDEVDSNGDGILMTQMTFAAQKQG